MRTSDGVRPDADVWRSAGEGPWPVLIDQRTITITLRHGPALHLPMSLAP